MGIYDYAGCKRPFFESEEEALECQNSTGYKLIVVFIFLLVFLIFWDIIVKCIW